MRINSKAFAVGVFAALLTLTALAVIVVGNGVIQVTETISATLPDGADITVGPNETVTKRVVVTNSGSVTTDVIVSASAMSDLGGPLVGLEVVLDLPQPISVPPVGSVTAILAFTADNGVPIQAGTVTYEIIRPDSP